ncbi:hypothetical protein BY996DRAFT_7040107 [Phakopsora pachyrhizi]|nr:hypothetical protein BY996DRAFT_7040107 [Phakopsora pachyrhizi]
MRNEDESSEDKGFRINKISTVPRKETIVIPLATDERCWFRCRQTNAGRVRSQDPYCSMFCYYSNNLPLIRVETDSILKNKRSDQSSSLDVRIDKTENDERTKGCSSNKCSDAGRHDDEWDRLIDRYSVSFLEGKFIYFASGKPAIVRHLGSMKRLGSMEEDWELEQLRLDQQKSLQIDKHLKTERVSHNPNQTSRGLMALAYHRDYERLINLSYSFASGLASVHCHFEKIYGPAYKILNKLPTSISQLLDPDQRETPSQFLLINKLFKRSIMIDSIDLMNRSVDSVFEVMSRLSKRYLSSLSKDSSGSDGRKRPPGSPSSPPPTTHN